MIWPYVTDISFIRRLPRARNQLLAGNWSLKLNDIILYLISKMIFPQIQFIMSFDFYCFLMISKIDS